MAYHVMRYSLFPLRQVKVVSANFQDAAALEAAFLRYKGQNVYWLSWFGPTPVFPKLEGLSVRVADTNTLLITVTEKKPWLAFLGDEGSVVVAEDGTVLSGGNSKLRSPTKELLVVKGLSSSLFQEDRVSQVFLDKLRTIVDRVRYHFPDAALQLDCTGVDFSSEFFGLDNFVLIRDDTLPIRLGSLEGLEEKLVLLKNFFWYYNKELSPKVLHYIDMRAPGKVIVKYREHV